MSTPTADTYPDLFWGYLLIWVLLSVYLIILGIKCSRLEKKISDSSKAPTSESTT